MSQGTPQAAIQQGHPVPSASLDSGAFRGSLKNYLPTRVHGRDLAAFERNLTMSRVDDLYGNDGIAKSGVNSIATNVIGTGLTPQSVIPAKRLGIDPAAAKDVSDQMEWLWSEWCGQAHYRDQMGFEDLQMLGLRSLIRNGELVHLPVMEERPGSRFALRIQDIRPSRLRTPWDKQFDPLLHDGVELTPTGVPLAYWIANPTPSPFPGGAIIDDSALTSGAFRRVPARLGHRRGMFHIFRAESEEQFRGTSCLAPAVKFFRHLNDSIDYELMAQVLAAAFPVFVGLENGPQSLPGYVDEETDGTGDQKRYYQDIPPGGIMYGNKGEKPEVLESKRPSANFLNFCELVLRILASALEIPYEVLTKDFSKTTYSSARAALLEAWRVYEVYRSFFVRHYCQPIWTMVQEEAWLRGYLQLPKGSPDFYAGLTYWCNTRWIGPARGYIDPTKEIAANIAAIEAGLMTRSEAIAERGGDFDEVSEQLANEQARLKELGVTLASAAVTTPAPAAQPMSAEASSADAPSPLARPTGRPAGPAEGGRQSGSSSKPGAQDA